MASRAEDIRELLEELGLTELAAVHTDRMERVLVAPVTHKEQPLARLLRARHHPKDQAASRVTDQAVRWLKERGFERWLKHRLRAAASSDYATASSALGEIRSLGQLATVVDQVAPIERGGDPTPDFDVTVGSERLVVEVKTLNMNEEEATALKAFHESREGEERVPFPGVAVREHSTAPLGRPRDGELLGQRVARKFFSLSDDTQADPARTSLLWIDLFDDDAWVLSADAFAPVVMHQGQFFSVGGWHGFYGLRDTALFERDEPQWGVLREAKLLGFDGRFASGCSWAAVILALPECTLFLENPSPRSPISDTVRDRFVDLVGVDLSKSRFTYPAQGTPVKVRIEQALTDLQVLYRHGGRFLGNGGTH